MLWYFLAFVIGYIVLMGFAAIAELRGWEFLRLICLYALTTGFGVFFAFLVSLLVHYWFPKLAVFVFLGLVLWWSRVGWRYAKARSKGLV